MYKSYVTKENVSEYHSSSSSESIRALRFLCALTTISPSSSSSPSALSLTLPVLGGMEGSWKMLSKSSGGATERGSAMSTLASSVDTSVGGESGGAMSALS
jgi:hypothetical protein